MEDAVPTKAKGGWLKLNQEIALTCRDWLLLVGIIAGGAGAVWGYGFSQWSNHAAWVERVDIYIGSSDPNAPPGKVDTNSIDIKKIQDRLAEQARASATGCLLGYIPRPYCIDQQLKVPPLPGEQPHTSE